jgi:NAD(P)-dependent dehydrogenase (short-subunit alcohol dehydrogenase family)
VLTLTGRVAIVSGGTGALGQSVTTRLLSSGATVWVPYIVPAELESLKSRLGSSAGTRLRCVHADVTDENAFGEVVRAVRDTHGRIDILVNGVGGFAVGDLGSISLVDWDRMLKLNLTSAVIGCRGVLPVMTAAGFGRIVNISSRAVITPAGGFIAYTVAKAAVITLTEALAKEVPHGITVNAVLPSTMDTPANRQAMPDADRSTWVSTDAVAEAITFLASDAGGGISGAAIPV